MGCQHGTHEADLCLLSTVRQSGKQSVSQSVSQSMCTIVENCKRAEAGRLLVES
jgi:hypothetical protein